MEKKIQLDYVDHSVQCPKCGVIVSEFKSKDGNGDRELISIGDANYFYSICSKCNARIEYRRKRAKSISDFDLNWR